MSGSLPCFSHISASHDVGQLKTTLSAFLHRSINTLMPSNLMTLNTGGTQFTLFDRPSSLVGHQAPRQQRRAQLPDLVRDVGQLENDDLVDLIRIAIGEARRRGIGPASAAGDSSRT